MKLNKILCLGLITTSVLAFNIPTMAEDIESVNIEIIDTIENDNSISPNSIPSYSYSKLSISGGTSFETSISLTSTDKYGKAFYSNNSNYSVTMTVTGTGVNESITIPKNTSKGISWTKGGIGTKEYKIQLRSSGDLNGLFSLAKCDEPF